VESGLYFVLGFLTASLIALVLVSAAWSRIKRIIAQKSEEPR
jgi:hypothetical protein